MNTSSRRSHSWTISLNFVAPSIGVAVGEKKFRIDIDADVEPRMARVEDMTYDKMWYLNVL